VLFSPPDRARMRSWVARARPDKISQFSSSLSSCRGGGRKPMTQCASGGTRGLFRGYSRGYSPRPRLSCPGGVYRGQGERRGSLEPMAHNRSDESAYGVRPGPRRQDLEPVLGVIVWLEVGFREAPRPSPQPLSRHPSRALLLARGASPWPTHPHRWTPRRVCSRG
jgi:hypothetical protein